MKTILAVLLAVGLVAVAGAQSKSTTCTLKVTGMTCAGCAAAVKIAAKKVDGVTDITVSYDKSAADVTYDPAKTTPAAIAEAITEKTGFRAVPKTEPKTQSKK
jgi:copper chaperone CopZ